MRAQKKFWFERAWRAVVCCGAVTALLLFPALGFAQSGSVPAESVPSNATPLPNETITAAINIDVSSLQAPNHNLGSYQATLAWNPAVLQFVNITPAPAPWNSPSVNPNNAANGRLEWNAFQTGSSTGKINLLNVNFRVIGAAGMSDTLRLNFSALFTTTFIDIRNRLAIQNGKVTVRSPNSAPVLAAIPDQTMNEGDTLDVPISATDPDGGKITLTYPNPLSFGKLTDNRNGTGRIRFTPDFFAAGIYQNIQVTATDDGTPPASATVSFKLTVNNVNRAPQIRPPDAITLFEGDTLKITLSAEDPDGDRVKLRLRNLPAFGFFSDNGDGTGTLRLRPGRDDAGQYSQVTIVATDTLDNRTPNLSDSKQLDLTVIDRFPSLACTTKIASPQNGAVISGDSVQVCVTTQVSGVVGAVDSLKKVCNANGVPLLGLCVKVPLTNGLNTIIATCTFKDSLSSCTSADTIRVEVRPDTLICNLTLSPPSGSIICGDSVEVKGTVSIIGGTPGYTKVCDVNGVPARNTDTGFILKLPCTTGNNTFIATCKVTDAANRTATCVDTINVIRPAPLVSKVDITAPASGVLICDKAVKVTAVTSITGGVPPFMPAVCSINGVAATVTGNTLTATVPLTPGNNILIATCTVTDSCGKTADSRDTVRVTSIIDNLAPTSTFTPGYKSVTGTVFDNESGIAKIEPIFLFNAKLTVDAFAPGAKSVNFRVDDLGLESYLGFDIKITDLCGNSHICDPVLSYLSADEGNRKYTFRFRSVDRYLILENHGLSEIRVDLNGHLFSLSAQSSRSVRNRNTYAIPEEGSITIDLQPYLREGENVMRLEIEGRSGTGADFTLIDATHIIDHTLELQPIPTAFQLSQNYPNPFNPSTTIRFGVPANVSAGAAVQLRLYNTLGELVRTLVDEKMLPGQYAVEWNGRDDRGEAVASGIYLYRLVAGDFRETKRMMFLK
jgi:hypothetical protein